MELMEDAAVLQLSACGAFVVLWTAHSRCKMQLRSNASLQAFMVLGKTHVPPVPAERSSCTQAPA